MPTPIITDAMEVQVLWTLAGQSCENRIYVRADGPPSVADLVAVADFTATWVDEVYRLIVSDTVTFTGVQVTDRATEGGPQHIHPLSLPGLHGGGALPNEVSFCVKLTTGFTGRSRRGRWYMPPPCTDQLLNANTVLTAYANSAASALQGLIDFLAGGGYRTGVVSLMHNGVPVVAPLVLAYTIATYADLLLDSMKSRKPGIGS